MNSFRTPAALAAFGLAGVLLAGCASSPSTAASGDASPTTASALEAATITLYTSEPQEKADALVEAFNQVHPEVTVEVFRAGTGDLTTRVATEQASGGVQADVFLAADAGTFEDYAADELLLQYSPADVESLNQDIVDQEGYYTGTRIIPTVIAYNTGLVTEPPTSWAELTDAEYANKLVMPNPDVSGAAAYNAAVWLDEPALGEEWLTKLAANKPVIADSNGPVSQAIATGAQPVGIVVDFLVSAEGQELAVSQSYLPVREDVGTPEGAPSMDEITILSPELETIRASQDAAVEKFRTLFL